MRRKLLAVAACVSLALGGPGCATIVSHSSWPIIVKSEPSGMTVTIKDETGTAVHRGVTPFTATLKSGNGYFAGMDYTLEWGSGSMPLASEFNPWYIGNIVFGGLIGLLIVDPLTGAMWSIPDEVTVGRSNPQ